MNNRIANASFVFACLVVFVHCVPGAIMGAERFSAAWWVKELFTETICRAPVPFFFCVSGYLLAKHVGESGWWHRAVQSRVKTLLVPYVILNLGYLTFCTLETYLGRRFLGTCGESHWHGWLTIPDALGLTVATPFLVVLWYVKQLILFILISYPFVAVIKKSKSMAVATMLGVLLIGAALPLYVFTPIYFGQMFFFLAGIAIRIYGWEPKPLKIVSGGG